MFYLLAIRTDVIFYILAVVCFIGFLIVLVWYLSLQKKEKNNKTTKAWTIESAKKFLEANNMEVKTFSNEKANENLETKTEVNNTASKDNNAINKTPVKTPAKTSEPKLSPTKPRTIKTTTKTSATTKAPVKPKVDNKK